MVSPKEPSIAILNITTKESTSKRAGIFKLLLQEIESYFARLEKLITILAHYHMPMLRVRTHIPKFHYCHCRHCQLVQSLKPLMTEDVGISCLKETGIL